MGRLRSAISDFDPEAVDILVGIGSWVVLEGEWVRLLGIILSLSHAGLVIHSKGIEEAREEKLVAPGVRVVQGLQGSHAHDELDEVDEASEQDGVDGELEPAHDIAGSDCGNQKHDNSRQVCEVVQVGEDVLDVEAVPGAKTADEGEEEQQETCAPDASMDNRDEAPDRISATSSVIIVIAITIANLRSGIGVDVWKSCRWLLVNSKQGEVIVVVIIVAAAHDARVEHRKHGVCELHAGHPVDVLLGDHRVVNMAVATVVTLAATVGDIAVAVDLKDALHSVVPSLSSVYNYK